MSSPLLFAAFAAAIAVAGSAAAQASCSGQAPPGGELKGPVLEVLDGSTLCVARGFDPSTWVKVRLSDAAADPSATRGALMAASFGQDVVCRLVGHDGGDVLAICRNTRGSVGQLAGRAEIRAEGTHWR